MRSLVPLFILKQGRADNTSGSFSATAVNIDLIGFTAITQSIMQHSHVGVEALIDTINAIFTPAIAALENRGGFISGFAGDAFTALFGEDQWPQAVAAAVEIRDFVAAQDWRNTEYGDLKLAVRIGIGTGEVAWEIASNPDQSVYWFHGSGITRATEAQLLASPNEVVSSLEPAILRDSGLCSYESKDAAHCRILTFDAVLPPPDVYPEELTQQAFVPQALSQLQAEGEFRDVLSCFVNLHTDDPAIRHRVIDSAIAHGGYISHVDCTDKGWVMYAMFGAPICYERNQLRAISFALEQQAAFGTNIRIGMSEGRAYAGFVGSTSRGEYTGMGNAVNLAARMMLKAAWGEVWLDSTINKAVDKSIVCERLGLIEYKGYPHPLDTYKLIARQQEAEYHSFTNKFCGRQAELELLISSCQELFSGKFAGVSYLYGAAGQGKSRLLYELKQSLGNKARYMYLQSDSIHRTALNPFAAWVRNEFTRGLTGTQAERVTEFRRNWDLLAKSCENLPHPDIIREELHRIESIIASLAGLEWEESLYSQLDAHNRTVVTGFAIKSLIEILSMLKPVVLIIEDLHWLDKDSKEVIVLLTRKAANIPLKIIITSRLGDDGSKPAIALDKDVKVCALLLDGLNSLAVNALMQDVLSLPVSPDLLSYVQGRSQGNPFIVVQLSIYLLETSSLELLDGQYNLKESSPEIPESVQAILVARIDRLEADLKRMVHTASVLGCEFARAILCAMMNDPESKPVPLCAEIVHSKLRLGEMERIWSAVNEISYIFSHSLLRDAAYGMQLMKQLKHLHLLAAEAMKQYYAEDKARFGQIAYHFEKAGEKFPAAQFHQKTGDYELELFHYSAALEHFNAARESVLSLFGDRDSKYALCIGRIGVVYWQQSEYEKAIPYFQQSLSIREDVFGKDSIECVDNIQNIGIYYHVKGNYKTALSYLDRALEIQKGCSGESHPTIASILNNIANVYRDLGDYQKALDYYRQTLAIRKLLWGEKHATIATTYFDVADLTRRKGEYSQAMAYYEKALAIRLEVLGEKHPATASSLERIGGFYCHTGNYDKALAYHQQALSIQMETLGSRHTYTADTLNSLGIVCDITEEYEKSLDYYHKALQIKREVLGDRHADIAQVLNNIGSVYDHQGQHDLALEQHEKALAIWLDVLGERFSETASCINNIGCAYENKGEYDKALGYYERALGIYLEVGGEKCLDSSFALVNIGCIHEHKKDYHTAIGYYNRALEIRQQVLGSDHPVVERTRNNIIRLQALLAPDQQ